MPSSLWHWLAVVAAALLALAGVAILTLALFRDRANGSPRCPKCWYSMAGATGLKCPECGHEVRHSRRLLKTRRRWRRVAIGALMLIIAAATAIGEPLLRKGFIKGTPTWAYIAALPWLEDGKGWDELEQRARDGGMRRWEYRALVSQILDTLERGSHADRSTRVVGMLPVLFDNAARGAVDQPYLSWARLSDLDTPRMAASLLIQLDRSDRSAQNSAIECLQHCHRSASMIIPALIRRVASQNDSIAVYAAEAINQLGDPHPEDRMLGFLFPSMSDVEFRSEAASVFAALQSAGGDSDAMVRTLSDRLRLEDSEARQHCIWALFHIARDDPRIQDQVFALMADSDERVQRVVAAFAGRVAPTQRSIAAIRAWLADGSEDVRRLALWAIEGLGPPGRVFEDDVRPLLGRPDMRADAIKCWLRMNAPRDAAWQALRRAIGDADNEELPGLLSLAAMAELREPELLDIAAGLMRDDRAQVRATAAYASIRLGGDRRAATLLLLKGAIQDKPNKGSTLTFAGSHLHTLAFMQLLDVPTLIKYLDTGDRDEIELSVSLLEECGDGAAAALPSLRSLTIGAPIIATSADQAVRRIEWELSHPKQAAELRKQRVRERQ